MDAPEGNPILLRNGTKAVRTSDREMVVTRHFDAPAHLVFKAWTTPDILMRWWMPASYGIAFLSCEADVRTGGTYRFVFKHPEMAEPMAFFGRYLEVIANERLVWTNEESADGAVSTVTFNRDGDATLLVLHEIYPSKEALDDAIASGSVGGMPDQFDQLDDLLVILQAGTAGR